MKWVCFHCGAGFNNEDLAREHFGLSVEDLPACVEMLTEGQSKLIGEVHHLRYENRILEEKLDEAEDSIAFAALTFQRFDGARDEFEARGNFESIQGRALTAEAVLKLLNQTHPNIVAAARATVCGEDPEKDAWRYVRS